MDVTIRQSVAWFAISVWACIQGLKPLGRRGGWGGFVRSGSGRCRFTGRFDRQHYRSGACLCRWGKKSSAEAKALVCSAGGFTCKIHALVNNLGYPLRFLLTLCQASDIGQAEALVISVSLNTVMADKGYDAQAFVDYLKERYINAVIPSHPNALNPCPDDKVAYRKRYLIQCYFNKMKHYRRVFSRFDKKAQNFLDFLYLAAVLIWTR